MSATIIPINTLRATKPMADTTSTQQETLSVILVNSCTSLAAGGVDSIQ